MGRDSVLGTLLVALVLCVVCAFVVSTATVALHPRQEANKALDKKKNILAAAGLIEGKPGRDEINRIFDERVRRVLVNLDTGKLVPPSEINPEEYDQREAADSQELSEPIETEGSKPGLDRREKYAFVYQVMVPGSETTIEQYVFPIYGKGLWSTLYGFIALDADGETIRGITFYEHGETPGLGGEVDNKAWQAKWPGKLAYNDQGEVVIKVIKGTVDTTSPAAEHEVDGLSGATITTRGVSNLVRYWLGPDAFGPYLKQQTAVPQTASM